jgi:putative FmdB family regulatory protein
MPLYEYQCEACGKRFEVIQKFSDPPAETCRVCGKGPVQRLFSSPAIQFKGTGWYITDYSQKGKSSGSDGDSSGSASDKDGKDTKSAGKSDSAGSEGTKTVAPASTPASKSDSSS